MTQKFVLASRWLSAACLLVMAVAPSLRAAESETRDFMVRVDGKPCGNAVFTIQRQDDGTTVVTCDTNVVVKVLIKKYVYTCRSQETWKNGRLQQLSSQCNDDGKQYQVTGVAQTDGIHVRVNGRENVVRPEAWVTSYWKLPDPKLRDQIIPTLEGDNGREMQGRLQYVGAAQIAVAGQLQNVHHYRYNGPTTIYLYYDANETLVRREWVEEGHPTVLELTRLRR